MPPLRLNETPKINVFCALSERTVYGSFIFDGQTIAGQTSLRLVINWSITELDAEVSGYFFS